MAGCICKMYFNLIKGEIYFGMSEKKKTEQLTFIEGHGYVTLKKCYKPDLNELVRRETIRQLLGKGKKK